MRLREEFHSVDDEAPLAGDGLQGVVELRVDEQHAGAGVLDDVGDLLGDQPEVDGHEHPAGPADAEEAGEQPGRVVADDRHPLARCDAEAVEPGCDRPRAPGDLGVGQRAPRRRRLVELVDDAGAFAVQQLGATQEVVDGEWHAHRTPLALVLFVFIGIVAGMFGLGAGWANVPALNLAMGVPLKVAAGTSSFIISPAAALVYLNEGALLPMIAAPSVIGMMLGAKLGGRLLHVVRAIVIRRLVLALMLFAGLRALGKGSGLWI